MFESPSNRDSLGGGLYIKEYDVWGCTTGTLLLARETL